MYPFRMCGRVVEVCRWRVDFPGAGEEDLREPEYFPTREEAEAAAGQDGTVSPLDTGGCGWMDGIETPDVPDTYAEAVKIYEMGPEAWQQALDFERRKAASRLRADLDYVMLMGGL